MAAQDAGTPAWTQTDRLDSFDSTLANLAEVVFACLDAAGARSVVEIGAEYGLFTKELLAWAERSGGVRVIAVDPAPAPLLTELASEHPELELAIETSFEALARIDPADAVIIDGDHNHFTVSEELRLVAERAGDGPLPLVMLHDVGWPLGRRDSYYAPERVPEEHRQPIYEGAFLVPDEPGTAANGLFFEQVAPREGGPANGVLTAVEDFVSSRQGLELAIVPAFFGLGVLWDSRAPWAESVAAVVAPYDRNPLLEQLERTRVDHLVREFVGLQQIDALRSAEYDMRFEAVGRLLPMHDSSAFAVGERLSRLHPRPGGPLVSREVLWRVITDLARDDVRIDHLRG